MRKEMPRRIETPKVDPSVVLQRNYPAGFLQQLERELGFPLDKENEISELTVGDNLSVFYLFLQRNGMHYGTYSVFVQPSGLLVAARYDGRHPFAPPDEQHFPRRVSISLSYLPGTGRIDSHSHIIFPGFEQ